MSARNTALQVLTAARKEQGWANGLLKSQIARDGLDRRDAALATRLCYGVVQNRGLLDFYLKQLLTGKVSQLRPVVRDILHLGLYQLYFMDKIPAAAAVNESAALAKKYCKKMANAVPLVNAVLRNAQRRREELVPPTALADKYSHPEGLIALFRGYVGEEKLEAMLAANNSAPDTVIQVNTRKTPAVRLLAYREAEGVAVQPHPWMKNCLILDRTGSIEHLEAFRKGLFYVQDPASRLSILCAQLPDDRDIRVLDCCAAPGGKSFAAAMAMEGRGTITACDVHSHKTGLISAGAERLGLDNITVRQQDATVFVPEWEKAMDAVIVDAPCSGLGIIRKKPDIRYKDLKETEQLPALQLQILENQSRYVAPGGVLMYSTCTVLKRENEDVVAAFLAKHPDFHTEKLPLPGIFPENTTGMLTLIPGQYDTDGFFICRLRRNP